MSDVSLYITGLEQMKRCPTTLYRAVHDFVVTSGSDSIGNSAWKMLYQHGDYSIILNGYKSKGIKIEDIVCM
jgi:hypothetical protein